MINENLHLAPITQYFGVQHISRLCLTPANEREGTGTGPSEHPNPSNGLFFYIHFTNIYDLSIHLSSAQHHLAGSSFNTVFPLGNTVKFL